jgi:hypothetical protein
MKRDELVYKANRYFGGYAATAGTYSVGDVMADFALKVLEEAQIDPYREALRGLETRLAEAETIIDSIPKTWLMSSAEAKVKAYRTKHPLPFKALLGEGGE